MQVLHCRLQQLREGNEDKTLVDISAHARTWAGQEGGAETACLPSTFESVGNATLKP